MGLYEEIAKKDKAIALEFKAVVRDNSIDKAGAIRLFRKALDPSGAGQEFINSDEAEALVLIVQSGLLSKEAKEILILAMMDKRGKQALFNGAGVELKKDDPELGNFHAVFAIKFTGNVKFYSPGTKHTYSPTHYQAVAELVKLGKIKVIKVMDRGLSATLKTGDALYIDEMFFFFEHQGEKFFSNGPEIVHEATHAIQDWFDINSILKYVETDAYIAQGAAGTKLKPALQDATQIVLKGQAVKGNKAWEKAYEAAVELVVSDPVYAARKDEPTSNFVETGGAERKEMERILTELQKPSNPTAPKSK